MNSQKRATKIQLQLALIFARDLQAQRNGDVARFDRMVDSKGKGVVRRSDAIQFISDVTSADDVRGHWPVTARFLARWLGQVLS